MNELGIILKDTPQSPTHTVLDKMAFRSSTPLIVAAILLLLSISWAGVLYMAENVKQVEIERSYSQSDRIATIFAEQVARTIDSVEALIDFAEFEILQHSSPNQLKVIADAGAFSYKPVVQITFVDTEGRTVATNAGPDHARTDLHDREHIRVHLQGDTKDIYIGAPVLGCVSGKWTIQLTKKIHDRNGAFYGIIVASVDPFYFARFWIDTLDRGRSVALYRADGALLTTSLDLQAALEQRRQTKNLLGGIQGRSSGRLDFTSVEGIKRLAFFKKIDPLPLVVFSGEPYFDVFKRYRNQQFQFYLIGLVLNLIIAALGLWLVFFAKKIKIEEESARQADKAKSKFLAIMSHEIRTPLNAVVGFAFLLQKSGASEEQEEYIRMIEGSADTLRSIVSDILDYSKLENNKFLLEQAPFDLRLCLAELKSVTTVLTNGKPIDVILTIAPDVPSLVSGDKHRFKQLLLNLCGNAAKYTEKGEISIRAGRAQKRDDRDWYTFEVSDTGVGVPEALREQMFLPFEQGPTQGLLRAEGTGLGLAITKRLLDTMGGHIRVESSDGSGSKFTFEIPLAAIPIDGTLAKHTLTEQCPPTTMRILVADDSSSSRMLLRILLQKMGHEVTEVQDGAEALDVLKLARFDLVFLDLQMPKLGGLDVARMVTAYKDTHPAPVMVALTAQAQEDDRREAIAAGMKAFITKPFRERDLVDILYSIRPTDKAH